MENNNKENIILNKLEHNNSDNDGKLEFKYLYKNYWESYIDTNDTIIILTIKEREKFSSEKINNLISKIVIINNKKIIYSDKLAKSLNIMNIERLNIFIVDTEMSNDFIWVVNKDSNIKLIKSSPEQFINFINSDFDTFLLYNPYSLYIIRGNTKGPSYKYIKYLFKKINEYDMNIGRGGSQKAHILSPLDFKLSCYLMAFFDFNHKLINGLNLFNELEKERYLSWWNRYNNNK